MVLLDADRLQRPPAAADLDQEGPYKHPVALLRLPGGEPGDVAGAVRDHRHQPGTGVRPDDVVGLQPDLGRSLDPVRDDRLLRLALHALRPAPAADLDCGDAGAGAPSRALGELYG